MHRRVTVGVLIAIAAVCCHAVALEIPLTFEEFGGDMQPGTFRPYGYAQLELSAQKPVGDWKLPELLADTVLYAVYEFQGAKRLIVFDKKDQDAKFFQRIIADLNGNNDLTDDTPVEGQTNFGDSHCFLNAEAVRFTPAGGEGNPYTVSMGIQCFFGGGELKEEDLARRAHAYIRPGCMYKADFTLDGRSYTLVLGDGECNGLFDEACTTRPDDEVDDNYPIVLLYGRIDQLYLSTSPKMDFYDQMPLGDYLVLGGRVYTVDIDIPGAKLTLEPAEEPLIKTKLPMEVERLFLYGENGEGSVMLYDPGKEAMIPQGKYRPIWYKAQRNDEQGDLWRVVAVGTKHTPYTTVAEGGGELAFGEPFRPLVMARKRGGGSRTINAQLSLNIRGCADEQVLEVAHVQGNKTKLPISGNRPKEASFTVVKEDGERAGRGRFEYG